MFELRLIYQNFKKEVMILEEFEYQNKKINNFFDQPYKYGFKTNIEKEDFPIGLNAEIIKNISVKKNEPKFLVNFRKNSFKIWNKLKFPNWGNFSEIEIDFNKIKYYSVPKKKKKLTSLEEVDPLILETFQKLGISLDEQKRISNVAIDAIFDSISIGTTFQNELAKHGVIFCSISEAIINYPFLIQKFLGTVIPAGDNFFAALNSAVFSDGSFCYIPKNIKCPLELSTYFRINDEESGQFERTLIIAEENSEVSYLEGCTAPKYDENQLHAAIVELIAMENAKIKYSTVQNWYSGNKEGKGGIFNFVTKRGLCIGKNSKISWTQVETGSAITWKYPSCVLIGENSVGEFYSVALTNNFQKADTGTKMIHMGEKTKSTIVSKGISSNKSINTYRGLVKIGPNANFSRNYSQCDSLLLGNNSKASTYPYIEVGNCTSVIEHEATISKISEEQLFYFQQRGIQLEQAIILMISGFCKEVFNKLPMEFAIEANKLLELKLERSIG